MMKFGGVIEVCVTHDAEHCCTLRMTESSR